MTLLQGFEIIEDVLITKEVVLQAALDTVSVGRLHNKQTVQQLNS